MGTEKDALRDKISKLVKNFSDKYNQLNEEIRRYLKYFENEIAKLLTGKTIFVPERNVQMKVGAVEFMHFEGNECSLKISNEDGKSWFYMRTDMEIKIVE